MTSLALLLLVVLIELPIGIAIIVGALKMMRLQSYGWATTAAVLALLPCSPASLLSLAMGIWSLVVLNRRQVKEGFQAQARLHGKVAGVESSTPDLQPKVADASLPVVAAGRAADAGSPVTQIRFMIDKPCDVAGQAEFHFSSLGYQLIQNRPDVSVFQRGGKWAALWETDIRAIRTILTVRTAPAADGKLWVSCDWSIRKLGSWITRGDIAILESEGRGLQELLDGKQQATDSDRSSRAEPATGLHAIAGTVLAVIVLVVVIAVVLQFLPRGGDRPAAGDPKAVVFDNTGPALAPEAQTATGLAPWQVAAVNAVLQGYYWEYIALEQKYTQRSVIEEGRQVKATVLPFQTDRDELVRRFQRQIKAITDGEPAAKVQALLPIDTLFPLGAAQTKVFEIRFDGQKYDVTETTEGAGTQQETNSVLAERHARFWKPLQPPPAPDVAYLDGHTDTVLAVAASPDGKFLVSSGKDGRVIIRPVDRPGEARVVGPGDTKYHSLAISQDSRFVLAVGLLPDRRAGPPSPHPAAPEDSLIDKISLDDGKVERLRLPAAKHVTHLFLCDGDSKVVFVDGSFGQSQIHLAELATGRSLGLFPIYFGGVPTLPKQNYGGPQVDSTLTMMQSFAVSPDRKYVAIATGIESPSLPDSKYQLSVLDMAGNRRLIAERDAVQRLRTAYPHFVDSQTLELASPSGQVHRWKYTAENDVWLEHPSRAAPRLLLASWFLRVRAGNVQWFGLDYLLVSVDAQSGLPLANILLKPKSGEGNFSKPIPTVAYLPGTTKIAAGLWDGRVAIVDTVGTKAEDPAKLTPPAADSDQARIQGTWRYVEFIENGVAHDTEEIRNWKPLVYSEGEWTNRQSELLEKGTYKLDPSRSPKTMDGVITEGPDKGLATAAIYELDDSTLKICFAPWGTTERPAEFSSPPGSRRTLIVLKREATSVAAPPAEPAQAGTTWDEFGAELRIPVSRPTPIHMAYSADGQTLFAMIGDDLHSWEHNGALTSRGRKSIPNISPGTRFGTLAIGGELLTLVREDGTVELWNLADQQRLVEFKPGPAHCAAFSPDRQVAAVGGGDVGLQLWDVKSNSHQKWLKAPAPATALAFSTDGGLLGGACSDGTIQLWEVASGEPLATLQGLSAEAASVAFAPDGERLAAASKAGKIAIWIVATGKLEATLQAKPGLTSLAFSPRGWHLVAGNENGEIHRWLRFSAVEDSPLPLGPGRVHVLQVGHVADPVGFPVQDLAVQGQHAFLILGDAVKGKHLSVFDVSDPSKPDHVGLCPPLTVEASRLAVSGNSIYVLDASHLQVFDGSDPLKLREVGSCELGKGLWDLAIQGRYAYVTEVASVRVIDLEDPSAPKQVGRCEVEEAQGIDVSGQYAYVACNIEGLHILDISDPASPKKIGVFDGPQGAADVVIDGKYAYVAGGEDAVTLWIADIADPRGPKSVGRYGDWIVGSVAVQDGLAFLGGDILDVSDPAKPVRVGAYGGDECVVAGNYIYIGDEGGLSILRVVKAVRQNAD